MASSWQPTAPTSASQYISPWAPTSHSQSADTDTWNSQVRLAAKSAWSTWQSSATPSAGSGVWGAAQPRPSSARPNCASSVRGWEKADELASHGAEEAIQADEWASHGAEEDHYGDEGGKEVEWVTDATEWVTRGGKIFVPRIRPKDVTIGNTATTADPHQNGMYEAASAAESDGTGGVRHPTAKRVSRFSKSWDSTSPRESATANGLDTHCGVHHGILKMFNEKKGFGLISPVQSQLPAGMEKCAQGLCFTSAPHLPLKGGVLGKQVRFSIQLSSVGKPQAVDVTLSEEVCGQSSDINLNQVVLASALPTCWTAQDLEHYFGRFGSVESVAMLPSGESGCVVLSSTQEAEAASSQGNMSVHGDDGAVVGEIYVQHFPDLPEDLQLAVQDSLADCLPRYASSEVPLASAEKVQVPLASAEKVQPQKRIFRPAKLAHPGTSSEQSAMPQQRPAKPLCQRFIGTVSNVVLTGGIGVISCSKLKQGVAAFDSHLAPDGALEGAVVGFHVDETGPLLVDGYAHAVSLEVLSRPSPTNASRLGAAANEELPGLGPKASYFKCFPCKAALKGCCTETECPDAHSLAELLPLPDTKAVRRVAKKRFGKAALLPMAAPMGGSQPMPFGMMAPQMAPVWGMNPMGMMPPFGMPPAVPGLMPSFFPTAPSRKKRRR